MLCFLSRSSGSTSKIIHTNSAGLSVQLIENKAPSPDARFWGNYRDTLENYYVSKLTISFHGQAIYVPYICYADLSNVYTVAIGKGQPRTVIISGGDGLYGYKCKLFFDPKAGYISTCLVTSGEDVIGLSSLSKFNGPVPVQISKD